MIGERSALEERRTGRGEDRQRAGQRQPGEPPRDHRAGPVVHQFDDAGGHHLDGQVDPTQQESEPRPVVPGLDDVGPELRSVGGHDPRAAVQEHDQRDEHPADCRGERPQRMAPFDFRQHHAERDGARREQAGPDVEQGAADDHPGAVGLGEPHLGGLQTEIGPRGSEEVRDTQPPDGGQRHEDPVAPQPDLQRVGPGGVCHGFTFPCSQGVENSQWVENQKPRIIARTTTIQT